MPESVTDRPTKAHEYVFLLAKQPRYFYDAEAIREDVKAGKLDGAMTKELQCWTDQKVLGPVIKGYHGPSMPCGWVYSLNLKLKNEERIFKARMVAHGNRDPRDIPTFSGTVDPGQFYVC